MSIKGIDTQIMINRSPDFSRDTSTLQRRPEMAQTNLAEQQKINDAEQQARVAGTAESEMDRIRGDDERSGNPSQDGSGERGEPEEANEEEKINPSLYVPAGNHMIDIMI